MLSKESKEVKIHLFNYLIKQGTNKLIAIANNTYVAYIKIFCEKSYILNRVHENNTLFFHENENKTV